MMYGSQTQRFVIKNKYTALQNNAQVKKLGA